jgi:phage gp16-like protein
MSTHSQIKQIHTLINVLGLDDELYRDMLASFGVCSSKDLTVTEAQIFIEILNDKVKSTKINCHKKYDDFYSRDEIMATPPQLRKIEAIWKDISNHTSKKELQKSLRTFLYNRFHISDIRFMTKSRASAIIPILEKIKISKYLKAI